MTKHRIMELLNFQVILEVKDGQKLYHARCYVGERHNTLDKGQNSNRNSSAIDITTKG